MNKCKNIMRSYGKNSKLNNLDLARLYRIHTTYIVPSRYIGKLGYLESVNMDTEKQKYFSKVIVIEKILKSMFCVSLK